MSYLKEKQIRVGNNFLTDVIGVRTTCFWRSLLLLSRFISLYLPSTIPGEAWVSWVERGQVGASPRAEPLVRLCQHPGPRLRMPMPTLRGSDSNLPTRTNTATRGFLALPCLFLITDTVRTCPALAGLSSEPSSKQKANSMRAGASSVSVNIRCPRLRQGLAPMYANYQIPYKRGRYHHSEAEAW